MTKILIVDDMEENVKKLSFDLINEGYEILSAADGSQALQLAKQYSPDVILLDIVMPGMDGVEVCRHLKADPDLHNIPVIIVSAKDQDDDIISGLDAGGFDYVSKPYHYRLMAARLRSAVRIKKYQDLLTIMNENLDEARIISEKASRSKSDFLANISHEIRTPMNGVLGMATLLMNTQLDDEQLEYVSVINSAGNSLLCLINDILDFSEMETGKLDIADTQFNLRSALDESLTVLLERAKNKNIEMNVLVHSDVPQQVRGDPGRIRQILVNLIGNAVKFTDKGEISISARIADKMDNNRLCVEFSVKDTGIGLTLEEIDRIFDSFEQVDRSATRRFGGTGLGLAICRRLVELMGGRIGVESEPGKGSCFWFKIPLAIDYTEIKRFQRSNSLDKYKILVVDADLTNQKVIEHQLKNVNCEVLCVSDQATALSKLSETGRDDQLFDLAIIDFLLPGGDGLVFGKEIRCLEPYQELPLILTSSKPCRGQGQEATDAGFGAYLSKPIRYDHLIQCIHMLLEERRDTNSTHPSTLITRHQLREMEQMKKLHILLAEDNPINQKVAVKILKKVGCRVDVESNSRSVVDAVFNNHYDLVLMDVQMPELTGLELTKIIRKNTLYKDLPIIGLITHSLGEKPTESLSAGMNDVLLKPIKEAELIAKIERWTQNEINSTSHL